MLSGGVKEKIGRDVRRGDWINFRWCWDIYGEGCLVEGIVYDKVWDRNVLAYFGNS